MQNFVGKQIDRYRITERLGMGGMAVVYKAYDTRLERDVALKIIRTEAIPPEQYERLMKRFEREAKSQGRFDHKHIVTVFDYGDIDGAPYLVMSYIPGGTLKFKMAGPVDWQQAIRWMIPIAEALAYAHEYGVVHRDVKPSNILFDKKGQPILTDFGIAKLLETDEATLTGTGMGVGTPEYMAPEQWQGKASEAIDQYALGVVLYELITGQKPYTADTPAAIILMQANEPLRAPSQIVRDIPEAVEKVLYKALARDPQDRYKDMGAFKKALEGPLAGGGIKASESVKKNWLPKKSVSKPVVESEGETRDALDPTPMDVAARKSGGKTANPKAGSGKGLPTWLPKWALWVGGGVIGLGIIGLMIGIGGNLVNMGKGGEGLLARLATATSTLTMTPPPSPSMEATKETEMPLENQELILTPSVTQDTEVAQSDESVLFFEDFEDSKTQNIRYASENWKIISDETGNYVYDIDNSKGSAFPSIDFGAVDWRDYEIKFRFRFMEANERWVVVYFRRDDSLMNNYNIDLRPEGVGLYYTERSSGWYEIIFREHKLTDNTWYWVRIITVENEIQVYIDDYRVIFTDDSHYKYGSIVFQIGPYSHAQFDDIQVNSLE